ncbi:hypothetical protein BDW69DRAFT_186967 [Aspergillus filifer]
MSEGYVSSYLGLICQLRFDLRDAKTLEGLKKQASDLATWFAVAEQIATFLDTIQRGEQLPIKRLSWNIKALSSKTENESRWARLNSLGPKLSLFCMVAISRLPSLPDNEFDSLVANVKQYVAKQEISLDWVYAEKIRKVAARTPKMAPFFESYYSALASSLTSNSSLEGGRTGDENTNAVSSGSSLKRRRTGDPDHEVLPPEKREMKHMFSNAPASSILQLPEPFKTAIKNSQQWKLERNQNLETTSCLASLFPRSMTQDVSFTIWCGHDDGYLLNDFFHMTTETPYLK